jgi:hypothetical protein
VHGPPFGPVNPALHVQSVMIELDIGEFEFAGHVAHEALDIFPTPDKYPFNSDEAEAKSSFDR